jgi:hypothetical protein
VQPDQPVVGSVAAGNFCLRSSKWCELCHTSSPQGDHAEAYQIFFLGKIARRSMQIASNFGDES